MHNQRKNCNNDRDQYSIETNPDDDCHNTEGYSKFGGTSPLKRSKYFSCLHQAIVFLQMTYCSLKLLLCILYSTPSLFTQGRCCPKDCFETLCTFCFRPCPLLFSLPIIPSGLLPPAYYLILSVLGQLFANKSLSTADFLLACPNQFVSQCAMPIIIRTLTLTPTL